MSAIRNMKGDSLWRVWYKRDSRRRKVEIVDVFAASPAAAEERARFLAGDYPLYSEEAIVLRVEESPLILTQRGEGGAMIPTNILEEALYWKHIREEAISAAWRAYREAIQPAERAYREATRAAERAYQEATHDE